MEIAANSAIHGVSITGSVPTGKHVYAAAARNLIPVQLEMGGKNAAILNDFDGLEQDIAQIMDSAFMTSG